MRLDGTVKQAAEKSSRAVILKPDAFCRAEEPALFSVTREKKQILRFAQNDP